MSRMKAATKAVALEELATFLDDYKIILTPSGDGELIYVEFPDGTYSRLTAGIFLGDQAQELKTAASNWATPAKRRRL